MRNHEANDLNNRLSMGQPVADEFDCVFRPSAIVNSSMSRHQELPPLTRGSVIAASCRVSLLQSTDLPVTNQNPWYMAVLRVAEEQLKQAERPESDRATAAE